MIRVVSVAYGAADVLAKTLASWRIVNGRSNWVTEIWDNSPGGSAAGQTIRSTLPNSTVLGHGHNIGFAAGINRLAERASCGDLLVLLNLDVILTMECVDAIERVRTSREVFAIPLRTAGCVHCGITIDRLLNFRDAGIGARSIAGPSGGGAIIPVEVFAEVGQLNESYFAWGEDAEWSMRARQLGLRTRPLEVQPLIHLGGHSVSSSDLRSRRAFLMSRNRVIFWRQFSTPLRRASLMLPWLAVYMYVVMRGIREGTVRDRLRGGWRGISARIDRES